MPSEPWSRPVTCDSHRVPALLPAKSRLSKRALLNKVESDGKRQLMLTVGVYTHTHTHVHLDIQTFI